MKSILKYYAPISGNVDHFDPKDRPAEDAKLVDDESLLSDNRTDSEETSEPKSFKTSLRDALQEWSNDDARDIAEDDSTPLRSGL